MEIKSRVFFHFPDSTHFRQTSSYIILEFLFKINICGFKAIGLGIQQVAGSKSFESDLIFAETFIECCKLFLPKYSVFFWFLLLFQKFSGYIPATDNSTVLNLSFNRRKQIRQSNKFPHFETFIFKIEIDFQLQKILKISSNI